MVRPCKLKQHQGAESRAFCKGGVPMDTLVAPITPTTYEPVLLRNRVVENIRNVAVYISDGGYEGLRRALSLEPKAVGEEVLKAGLRGRGGAGFPAGRKWSFLPPLGDKPRYLVVNCDESEPGTFHDHEIIEDNPHLAVEGIIISSYATSVHHAFIYVRGEFALGAERLTRAVDEARAQGFLGKNILGSGYDLEITVHRGAGAYICGEESALLESLEGRRGYPRLRPPFPAVSGLYKSPTVINNIGTLANVGPILRRGADWYKSIGTEKSSGPCIYSISGHVERPGNYEAPMGLTMRALIYDYAGGVRNGNALKAIIPGGSSAPILPASAVDLVLDFDSVAQAGSMLGSAAIIIMDETTDMVAAVLRMVEFYKEESCGKCTPCREGTYWMVEILERMMHSGGRLEDIDLLKDVAENIAGKSFCLLGDSAAAPVISSINLFRGEYEAKITEVRQPLLRRSTPSPEPECLRDRTGRVAASGCRPGGRLPLGRAAAGRTR